MKYKIKSILKSMGFCSPDIESISDDIVYAYNLPERGYHGIKHILDMLINFDDFMTCSGCSDKINKPYEFAFAILMHDYVNGGKNDIELSIKKSKQFLCRISLQYDCRYVEKLIYATDYKKCLKPDFEQGVMQDLDLNIFGSSKEIYDEYSNKIRIQYKKYPDTIFNPERIEILNKFLNKTYIFNTKYYRDKYEKIARDNLIREIYKPKSI